MTRLALMLFGGLAATTAEAFSHQHQLHRHHQRAARLADDLEARADAEMEMDAEASGDEKKDDKKSDDKKKSDDLVKKLEKSSKQEMSMLKSLLLANSQQMFAINNMQKAAW